MRRPKDRSHWGEKAFAIMDEKRKAKENLAFLSEVERRVGATREEMLERFLSFGCGDHRDYCACRRREGYYDPAQCTCEMAAVYWLRRILGEEKS